VCKIVGKKAPRSADRIWNFRSAWRVRLSVRIRWWVVIGLLAFAAAGCFGGSSNGGSSVQVQGSVVQASTSVVISGGIGQPARSRDQAHAVCPSDATCKVVKVRGVSPTNWSAIAQRHLTCSPAGGDYRDPRAACRALADFLKPRAPNTVVCMCPLEIRPAYTIVGRYQDKPLHRRFDSCSMCGAPQQMQDAFNVLFNP
jgi:hypothetical protein